MINLQAANLFLKNLGATQRICWMHDQLPQGMVATTSGGRTSRILPSLIQEALGHSIPTVFVDTGHYPEETGMFVNTMDKEGIDIRHYNPLLSPESMEKTYGRLWEQEGEGFEQFLTIAKHEPLNRAFKELDAKIWVRGIMGFQTTERAQTNILEYKNNMYRLHPIIDWSYKDARTYLEERDLPLNNKHYDITKGPSGGLECRIGERAGII